MDYNRKLFHQQQEHLQNQQRLANLKNKNQRLKPFCHYDLICQHLVLNDINLQEKSVSGVSIIHLKPCNINLSDLPPENLPGNPKSKTPNSGTAPENSEKKPDTIIHPIEVNAGQNLTIKKCLVNDIPTDHLHSYKKGSIHDVKKYFNNIKNQPIARLDNFYDYALKSVNPYLDGILTKDGHLGKGELKVVVPKEIQEEIRFHEKTYNIRVEIHFTTKNPVGGFTFYLKNLKSDLCKTEASKNDTETEVNPPPEKSDEDHMYITTNSAPGTARLCFPCIDTWTALCTWTIEVTVDEGLLGLASGTLTNKMVAKDSKGNLKHNYIYELMTPSIAAVIGIFVGKFYVFSDTNPKLNRTTETTSNPNLNDRRPLHRLSSKENKEKKKVENKPKNTTKIKHLCPFPIANQMKETVINSPADAMVFYEELLVSINYPYNIYRQIFVYNCPNKFMNFAGFTVMDARILHPKIVSDVVIKARRTMCLALAFQFFGTYIIPDNDTDSWITFGLAGHIFHQWLKKGLGNSEFRHYLTKLNKKVSDFEIDVGPIILSPPKLEKIKPENVKTKQIKWREKYHELNNQWHFPIRYLATMNHDYYKNYMRKSYLVMRMFDIRLELNILNQAISKVLVLANKTALESLKNTADDKFFPDDSNKSEFSVQNNYYRGKIQSETITINQIQFLRIFSGE